MAKLLNLAGPRRPAQAEPVQKIVLLAGKRIPECDVVEACATAAAISVSQGMVTRGHLEDEWAQWSNSGMAVEVYLANRSDFAQVRKAAFSVGSTTVEVAEAAAVAFSPAEANLVPPRLQKLVADFTGRRMSPRKRASASTTPLLVWDESLPTPQAAKASVDAMHRWVRTQKPAVLMRWFNKGCRITVVGMDGENAAHMLTYGVDTGTAVRSTRGTWAAGVCSPPIQG